MHEKHEGKVMSEFLQNGWRAKGSASSDTF